MYTENTQTTEDLQANNIENEKENILKMYLNTLLFDKLQKYLIYLENMCFLIMIFIFTILFLDYICNDLSCFT